MEMTMLDAVRLAKEANKEDMAGWSPREDLAWAIGSLVFTAVLVFISRPKMPEMKIHLYHYNA